jgi:hypothetical protein
MSKRAIITGITGQDSSYLAELLLETGLAGHRDHPPPSAKSSRIAGGRVRPGRGWRDDATNYWLISEACVVAMLQYVGFRNIKSHTLGQASETPPSQLVMFRA